MNDLVMKAFVISGLVCLAGCVADPSHLHDSDQYKTASPEGHEDLYLSFTLALYQSWSGGCDIEKTADFYRKNHQDWQWIDLNGDNVDEVIGRGMHAIYEDQGKVWVGGATGNGPIYLMHKNKDRWQMIADLSGIGHTVTNRTINGWPVLSNTWKGGIDDFSTSVQVFDEDRYQTVVDFHQDGAEFLEGLH